MKTGSLNDELQLQVRKRFSNVETNFWLAAATFLDPRLKKVPFSNKTMVDQAQKRLETEMCSVSVGNLAQSEEPDEPTSIQLPSPNVEPTEEVGLWSWFGKKATEQQRHRTAVVDAALDMRHYTEGKLMTRTDDPLEFWKKHSLEYPRLSVIGKKFLSVPATSVPSERLFSKAGELVAAKRNRLKAQNIDMILFPNKNA
ncbi:Zinc finger BED domain-containing protein 1-like 2 [Homarus americanus]|uniref:Zinc finger BED domain-containing protein 1-like 2 n=1 Tax=Homarus americanus TaxID=6706 RepID=A0A8J5MJJ1_HOMAM|nr:Zinc finger BED domain-containing protein 1-like 2 [Homarus americanus]